MICPADICFFMNSFMKINANDEYEHFEFLEMVRPALGRLHFFLLYQLLSPAFLSPQSPFHRSAFQDEFHFHHLVRCLVTSIRFQMRDKVLK